MNTTTQRELRSLTDIFNGSYDAYYNSGTGMYRLLGNANIMKEDVIGVFFKKIPIYNEIAAYHTYILCHDHRESKQFIFRAGPSMDIEPIHAAVYFFTGATPPVRTDIVTFGYLKGEVGLNRQYELVANETDPSMKYAIGSPDYDASNSNLGVIVKKGDDLRNILNSFEGTNKIVNRLNIRYNPRYPNSNSYVTTLLKKAGLPSAKESIDSYPAPAENREHFEHLFTPGASVIDITRSEVIYDHRNARGLDPLASDADSTKVGEQLSTDNLVIQAWPRHKYFYNEGEYNLRVEINEKIRQIGMKKISIPKISH
jgi:hypothetical protein